MVHGIDPDYCMDLSCIERRKKDKLIKTIAITPEICAKAVALIAKNGLAKNALATGAPASSDTGEFGKDTSCFCMTGAIMRAAGTLIYKNNKWVETKTKAIYDWTAVDKAAAEYATLHNKTAPSISIDGGELGKKSKSRSLVVVASATDFNDHANTTAADVIGAIGLAASKLVKN